MVAMEADIAGRRPARLVGMDEVGRGPVAGPLVAAGVILRAGVDLPGVRDSKTLSDATRRRLLPMILDGCLSHAVSIVDPATIDSEGMSRSLCRAFAEVGRRLGLPGDGACLVLIDGLPLDRLGFPARFVCKGDRRSLSIAAASIIAKVTRDDIMIEADGLHPGYSFARNKGYLTPGHMEALRRLGPSPIHRRSFAPVRDMPAPGSDLFLG